MALFITPLVLEAFGDGSFALSGAPAGAAGVHAVPLDRDTVLETDAAEPARLVRLLAETRASLRHVEPLFGAGVAVEVTKLLGRRSVVGSWTVAASEWPHDPDPDGSRFGDLLARASVLHDPAGDEPVRAAAFLDAVEAVVRGPAGPLAAVVLDDAVDVAAELLEKTGDELASLAEDDAEIAQRLFEQTDEWSRDLVPGVAEPLERLHVEVGYASRMAARPLSAAPRGRQPRTVVGPPRALPAAAVDRGEVAFHPPNGVEVRRAGREEGEWLEAVRADDLVSVAFVPFQVGDAGSHARLLLPIDELGPVATTDDVLDRYRFRIARSASVPARTIDRVVDAIGAGKAALRAERLGDRRGAARWWTACARGWDGLDPERASEARQRATDRTRIGGGAPPTADLVANHRWYRS